PVPADLAAWATWVRGSRNRFVGDAHLDELERLGEARLGDSVDEIVRNRLDRGYERLRAGRVDDAITDLQAGLELAEDDDLVWRGRARELLAMAWMRRAELDNCVTSGTGASCLLPFGDAGVHAYTEGMTEAAALWSSFLVEDDPNKPSARWLYNVSVMALGGYPEDVALEWLIPPACLQPEAAMPGWTNVARDIGVAAPGLAGGSAVDDFDGDGLLDLLFSSSDPDEGISLYLNQGDGRFCDASNASGLSAFPGSLDISVADFDNDGDLDVAAPRAGWYNEFGFIRMSLLRNDGAGRFVDVAIEAGLAEVTGPSQVSEWADVDGDGWLDLFVGRERAVDVYPPASLYINRHDGTFEDQAALRGVAENGWVKGAAFGDIDDDGDPDLYVSTMLGPNHLYINDRERGQFIDRTAELGLEGPDNGFSTWFFDYDQDGDLDLFATSYPLTFVSKGPLSDDFGRASEGYVLDLVGRADDRDPAHLYRNDNDGMVDVRDELALDDVHAPMGSNFGDLDMDGWPDIYLGTGAAGYDALEPNVAYLNMQGARFLDVTSAVGLGHLQKGHGVSFGDLDGDGDEDIALDVGGAFTGDRFPNAVFTNPTTGRHGVTLRLEGVTVNRRAVGARVRVVTAERTFHHVVGTGSSYGNNSHQLEIGLGAIAAIERVEVDWPSGPSEVFEGVEVDHIVDLREGAGVVASRPYAPFALDGADAAPDHGGHVGP
ncbi:MAG TPA: CRTAC1 family protein, partial [Myxococcota bacterium]|nr:CRTAC1 family protein [Myxococcota bacterium]